MNNKQKSRKALITGVGVLSGAGCNNKLFFDAVAAGKSAIDKINSFDVSNYRTNAGAELTINPSYKKEGISDIANWIICCIMQALKQSNISFEDIKHKKVTIVLGTFLGEVGSQLIGSDSEKAAFDRIANEVSGWFNINTKPIVISTACTSGSYAIAVGSDLIKYNQSDIVFAGGYERLGDFVYAGMNAIRALGNDIRPFDLRRSGTVLGEGAGILLLESEESAYSRNAKIYGQILGYGLTNDAYHPLRPHADGQGMARAIQDAISNSGISAGDIDYINAHGTGTKLNDSAETRAIKTAFGEYAMHIPISSIKPVSGHTLGAAGTLGVITAINAIEKGWVPPTANYNIKDDECDLDYVVEGARKMDTKVALCNSIGFGGTNGALIIGQYPSLYDDRDCFFTHEALVISAFREKYIGSENKDIRFLLSEIISCAREVLTDTHSENSIGNTTGLVIDISDGFIPSQDSFWKELSEKAPQFVSPTLFTYSFPGLIAGELSRDLGITGPTITICDYSKYMDTAILLANNLIHGGTVKKVLVGKKYNDTFSMLNLVKTADKNSNIQKALEQYYMN